MKKDISKSIFRGLIKMLPAVALGLMTLACNTDDIKPIEEQAEAEKIKLNLTINGVALPSGTVGTYATEVGTSPENEIKHLRVFVFDGYTRVLEGEYSYTGTVAATNPIVLEAAHDNMTETKWATEKKFLYVVTNLGATSAEGATVGNNMVFAKPALGTTLSAFEQNILTYLTANPSAPLSNPQIMVGHMSSQGDGSLVNTRRAFPVGSRSMWLDLKRVFSKIRVKLEAGAGYSITASTAKFTLTNVATKTFLTEGKTAATNIVGAPDDFSAGINYTEGVTGLTYVNYTADVAAGSFAEPDGNTYQARFYVPENHRSDAYESTTNAFRTKMTIKVDGAITGGTQTEQTYTIDIPGLDSLIKRNTIYSITATINSDAALGSESVTTKLEVLPWNVEPQQEVTAMPMRISGKRMVMDYAALGDSFVNSCNIITTNPNAVTFSFIDAQPAWITNVALTKLSNKAQLDVTYKPTHASSHPDVRILVTDGIKKDTVTVIYDNGLILTATSETALAAQGFTTGHFLNYSVPADTIWPAVYPTFAGVQLNKRGDKILPQGVAEEQDPLMIMTSGTYQYFRNFFYATDVTLESKGLGTGKLNTDTMQMALPAMSYNSAVYCRSLGSDWYVPSVNEFAFVYFNRNVLGPSYTFNIPVSGDPLHPGNLAYWCSSFGLWEGFCYWIYENGHGNWVDVDHVRICNVRCLTYKI